MANLAFRVHRRMETAACSSLAVRLVDAKLARSIFLKKARGETRMDWQSRKLSPPVSAKMRFCFNVHPRSSVASHPEWCARQAHAW